MEHKTKHDNFHIGEMQSNNKKVVEAGYIGGVFNVKLPDHSRWVLNLLQLLVFSYVFFPPFFFFFAAAATSAITIYNAITL